MKRLIFFFMILALPAISQTEFKNGINTVMFSSSETDSTWADTTSVFKFNRDVVSISSTVSWDSVFSGTALLVPEVNNSDDDSTWILHPAMDTIPITGTNGAAIWHDRGFDFRFGRYRLINSDTLIHGTVTITTLVKTLK